MKYQQLPEFESLYRAVFNQLGGIHGTTTYDVRLCMADQMYAVLLGFL